MSGEVRPGIPDGADQFASDSIAVGTGKKQAQLSCALDRSPTGFLLPQRSFVIRMADFGGTRLENLRQHSSIQGTRSNTVDIDTDGAKFLGESFAESHDSGL